MDQFEYVVVLTSLILGLGIAQILTGIADILSNYKRITFYLPHTLFALQIFLLHIQEWWINYEYADQIHSWTLKTVLLILAYPIALFIMARMIFPTGFKGHVEDFKAYYNDQWRLLFVIGSLTVILSVLHNCVISNIPITDQFTQLGYLALYLGYIISNTKNSKAHLAFQLLTFTGMIIYIITDKSMLDFYG